MLDFVIRVLLYAFVLFHATGPTVDMFLIAASVVVLEFLSYTRGIIEGMEMKVEKVKNGDNNGN